MIKIELKQEELEVLLQALALQPYRSVAGLIQTMVGQSQQQTKTTPKEEAK